MLASRTVVCALALLTGAACAPKYFRDVPPSFVTVDEAVADVSPSPDAATVVIYDNKLGNWGTWQTFTIILGDGTALGQVPPKSWIAVQVPPGEQTIVSGIPEVGDVRPCSTRSGTFEAGRIYVLERDSLGVPKNHAYERTLSLLSRVRVQGDAGQSRVREQWEEFWKPCMADRRAQMAKLGLASERLSGGPTELKIPLPP